MQLKDILCHREQRYVSAQLTISFDRKQIIQPRENEPDFLTEADSVFAPLRKTKAKKARNAPVALSKPKT